MSKLGSWIEAMRLRTLPVSVTGVMAASAYAIATATVFSAAAALLCFLFAVLAQIASNFANEYYDYRDGLDKPGRVGPRRGVTEGDISATAMKRATFGVLALACAIGCSLIYWGGWWLIAAGVFIAVGVLAYSTGPYPLSHHGLGEVAVLLFFGVIPVNLTYYVTAGAHFDLGAAILSVAIGLMGANVLIVNNYRDYDDDKAVGKRTLAVIFGRKAMIALYAFNGIAAALLMAKAWYSISEAVIYIAIVYLLFHALITRHLSQRKGMTLNPLLGMTSMLMLATSLALLISTICL